MRKHSLSIVCAMILGIAGVSATSATATASTNSCPVGAVFSVGGTWDPTGQTTQPVTDRYTSRGYTAKPVTYPASFWPLGDQTYDESVAVGVRSLRADVNSFHAQCPDSNVVITGYSQGARIAGDVLGDIARDGSIPQSRVEGVLYADPRNSQGGIETVIPNVVPGATMAGTRDGFGDIPVQEICIEGDGICNMPEPSEAPEQFVDSVFGYFTKHGTYQPMMEKSAPPPAPALPQAPSAPLRPLDVATAIVSRVVENLTPYVTAALTAALTMTFGEATTY